MTRFSDGVLIRLIIKAPIATIQIAIAAPGIFNPPYQQNDRYIGASTSIAPAGLGTPINVVRSAGSAPAAIPKASFDWKPVALLAAATWGSAAQAGLGLSQLGFVDRAVEGDEQLALVHRLAFLEAERGHHTFDPAVDASLGRVDARDERFFEKAGMIEVADGFCGTSSIMPQKKNAWALDWTRGAAGNAVGYFASCLAALRGTLGDLRGGESPVRRKTRSFAHGCEMTVPVATMTSSGMAAQNPKTLCRFQSRPRPLRRFWKRMTALSRGRVHFFGNHRKIPETTRNKNSRLPMPITALPVA